MNSQRSYLAQLNRKPTAVLNIFFLLPPGSSITWSCIHTCNWKHWDLVLSHNDYRPVFVKRWWRGDMFHAQCWFFSPSSSHSFLHRLIRTRWLALPELLWRLEGVIRSAREQACLLFLSRVRQRRENFTPTERERQVSVWKGEHVSVCVCGHTKESKRVAFPHGRLDLGIASTKNSHFSFR